MEFTDVKNSAFSGIRRRNRFCANNLDPSNPAALAYKLTFDYFRVARFNGFGRFFAAVGHFIQQFMKFL